MNNFNLLAYPGYLTKKIKTVASRGCGFCKNVRLFFSLLKTHSKNMMAEYHAYKNVCNIAKNITEKSSKTYSVPSIVEKIREQAKENYSNPDSPVISPTNEPGSPINSNQDGSVSFKDT